MKDWWRKNEKQNIKIFKSKIKRMILRFFLSALVADFKDILEEVGGRIFNIEKSNLENFKKTIPNYSLELCSRILNLDKSKYKCEERQYG
jgi:hypothetical protein